MFPSKRMIYIGFLSFLIASQLIAQNINVSEFKSQKHEVIQTLHAPKNSHDAFAKLPWETDMQRAFQRAKKEHKNVILLIQDPWCKWCKKMKNETLSDPRVQRMLRNYILLTIERRDQKTVQKIEEFTGAIPSFYFMEPNGEVFESVIGYFQPEDFLQFLREIEESN